jgi:outer membrane lipoprotein-sorting protein
MDSFESRLKYIPLRRPSPGFGKPEALAAAMRPAVDGRSLNERIKNLPWKSKIVAILSVAASVSVVYLVLASATGDSVAFAQVAEKLRAARTLSYNWTMKQHNDGKVLNRGRNLYMVPGKIRIEYGGQPGQQSYGVLDMPGGQVLFVDEKQQTARVTQFKGHGRDDMAAKTIDDVRSLQSVKAQSIGDKVVDGVQAKGFQIIDEGEAKTVWADAATGNPVRIEILQNDTPWGPVVTIWSRIQLDQPLAPELFSTAIPAGFETAQPAPVLEATPAHWAADFLKIYVQHMDGQFPQNLREAGKELGQKFSPPGAPPTQTPSSDVMQAAFYGAAIAAATRNGQGERWQYYPGRAFGDPSVIVFWFHDKNNDKYQAVYGDLSVKTIETKDLPPLAE